VSLKEMLPLMMIHPDSRMINTSILTVDHYFSSVNKDMKKSKEKDRIIMITPK
jgi:hypothetical protein